VTLAGKRSSEKNKTEEKAVPGLNKRSKNLFSLKGETVWEKKKKKTPRVWMGKGVPVKGTPKRCEGSTGDSGIGERKNGKRLP